MKTIKVIITVFIAFLLIGCSSIIVPDVAGTVETVSVKILTDNLLIPSVEYEFSDVIQEGLTIKTEPSFGEKLSKNDKIVVFVSKGPAKITSKDSRFRWLNVFGSEKDDWIFYAPYIEENVLKIDLEYKINSKYKIEWNDYGEAVVLDSVNKTVPVKFEFGSKTYELEEAVKVLMPLADLSNKKPTSVNVKLYYEIDGRSYFVNMEFTISW